MEQRKRLTIAVELVTFPRILFLDEPTSGLDGSGALLVAGVMRAVADRGVAVVSTIHQPSAAIFGTFDELLLLQRRGRVVYNGPVGRDGECLVQYLRSAVPMAPAFVQVRPNSEAAGLCCRTCQAEAERSVCSLCGSSSNAAPAEQTCFHIAIATTDCCCCYVVFLMFAG